MKKILFQGDSITDCGRMTCGGAGFNCQGAGPGYAGMIAADLGCKYPGKYEIINRGISGNRIVDLYARWKCDCLNLKPDILSILIGVNDVIHETHHRNGVEQERFERIYREILQWTVDTLPGIRLILIGSFTGKNQQPENVMAEVAARAEITRKLAAEFNAVYMPGQELFDNAMKNAPSTYWIGDDIHPTPAGHRLMADEWERLMGVL